MTYTTIRINAARYEDQDDCLSAEENDYAEKHDMSGYDLNPRWEDEQTRDHIILDVPNL